MSDGNRVPSYRKHKQSGQAIVTLPDGLGGRRDILLGEFGTKQSRTDYARVIAEWESAGRQLPQIPVAKDLTINELILAFWKHAEEHYPPVEGKPNKELKNYKFTLRPLKEIYGETAVKNFGPLSLKVVRDKMINSRLCRNVVNRRISQIRRIFRWAVEQELILPTVLYALQSVTGLQRGRTKARESEPVRPVPEAVVESTLAYLRPPVEGMVRLQLLTGMRPGEVVIMRACDLDMTGKVWLYRPGSDELYGKHKTAWRGHQRIIAIGPRGQEIIKPFLKTELQAFLFSPMDAIAHLRFEQRARRKTKVQPSQENRKKKKPKRKPGNRYTVESYGRAVAAGCKRAFLPPEPLAQVKTETARQWKSRLTAEQKQDLLRWRQEHHWHPNQLRHTKATEIRREAGLDAARVVLGHRSPQITETYAEMDVNKAAEVMARLG
jgi:integrase